MRGGVVFCEEAGFVVGGEDEESEDGVEGEGGHGYYVKVESEGGGRGGWTDECRFDSCWLSSFSSVSQF